SDTFHWSVNISLQITGKPEQKFSSSKEFGGPTASSDSPAAIAGQIVRAWELALCRKPTEQELVSSFEFVSAQLNSSMATAKDRSKSQQALTNLCQALMSSNEFLYVE
ncbi:MAG: hypothetical protein JKY95_07185, partial [Planctomycetaceae bacterium]|nr:hypothetical protein [Planctomycetaceae bacterium]